MPKNSRPDIQVLEDRIVRLKAQLLEYKDLRLYGVTKKRLSAVSEELSECISIINEIVDAGTNNISDSSMSAYDVYPGLGPAEFSQDGDLLDTSLLNLNSAEPSLSSSAISSREIVSTYAARMKGCAETVGCSSGIIQVNQFCQVMNSWYQSRFTPPKRNPRFFFKADRIHEWIDLLMIAAGHSLNEGTFADFIADTNTWIGDLNTPKDQAWVLPLAVMRMKDINAASCSKEAVLLEKIIKPSIYSANFYPEEKHTVQKIVMNNTVFTDKDLELDNILKSCTSKLVITSSFDSAKYQED
mgnify:CR=1 FL=1